MNRRELIVTRKDAYVCVVIPEFNILERTEVTFNSERPAVTPLVICPPGTMPYASEKVIPYKYNATMIEDGREASIPPLTCVGNITNNSRVLRNGRVIHVVFPKKVSASLGK